MSLRAQDVTVSYYGDIYVLTDVSLEAQPKRVTTVIGPNGAGKSTLLKTMYGYLLPRHGNVLLNDLDITRVPPYAKLEHGIAYLPQDRSIFPVMTVEENLELGAWSFRQDRARVRATLAQVYERYPRLKERQQVKAGRLSGGEQRMLELGRALMTNPSTLLIDEPAAGLAPIVAREMYQALQALAVEGRTILLVDQNVAQGVGIADYVYVLEMGHVTRHGSRSEVEPALRHIVKNWVVF